MKNRLNFLVAALIVAAAFSSCNTLEVTMPRGPQGEQGIQGVSGKDGLSAYELWVIALKDKTIGDWTGGDSPSDFFKYLKGKDGSDGRDGKDGKTAYELWLEYVAFGVDNPKEPGTQWDKDKTTIRDFYDFLTGKDGDNGSTPYIGDNGNWWIVVDGDPRDLGVRAQGPKGDQGEKGDPGDSGRDGSDGASGDSPYIGENGNWWIGQNDTGVPAKGEKGDQGDKGDAGQDGENGKDGADGKDGKDGKDGATGLSAYELWVADVTSDEGLDNPGNGIYDPDEYPKWPKDATSVEDFYKYLTGKDGKDGNDGGTVVAVVDTLYAERVDKAKYNVAPVIALSKEADGGVSYEYVNPFSGGAAFIVTGPGPVIIPGCEVTFTTMDGSKTYSKTSDSSGYIYLTRSELPDWYDGAPDASDNPGNLSSGVRPLSFSYGDVTVTDESKIAATCKVPYKVDLEMTLVDGLLSGRYSLAKYEIHRIVEGEREEEAFVLNSSRGVVSDYRGYGIVHNVPATFKYYRNEGAVKFLREIYDSASQTGASIPTASSDDELLEYFGTIGNIFEGDLPSFYRSTGSEGYGSPVFGDAASPAIVGVYDTFTYISKGSLILQRRCPDYGLKVDDPVRTIHIPSVTELPDRLVGASYVWENGHTTLTFELDWNSIGKMQVVDGYSGEWVDNTYTYPYDTFDNIPGKPTSDFSSFRAAGKFNGSKIDSKVRISWKEPVVFTDIYGDFSVSIADVSSSYTLFAGLGDTFLYDPSDDDENGRGEAYLFGQKITKTNE